MTPSVISFNLNKSKLLKQFHLYCRANDQIQNSREVSHSLSEFSQICLRLVSSVKVTLTYDTCVISMIIELVKWFLVEIF